MHRCNHTPREIAGYSIDSTASRCQECNQIARNLLHLNTTRASAPGTGRGQFSMSRKASTSRRQKVSARKPKPRASTRAVCPSATYRLQLHAGFTLDDAAQVLDYLAELGISHAYLSPYLQAVSGSMHGYDPVDPGSVSLELGGEEAHQRFCRRLGELGLGQILDIVPNHMAVAPSNKYWWDILENGSSSRYANYFDIDWQPMESRLQNKVLAPVLADQFGAELERGAIHVARTGPGLKFVMATTIFPSRRNPCRCFWIARRRRVRRPRWRFWRTHLHACRSRNLRIARRSGRGIATRKCWLPCWSAAAPKSGARSTALTSA